MSAIIIIRGEKLGDEFKKLSSEILSRSNLTGIIGVTNSYESFI